MNPNFRSMIIGVSFFQYDTKKILAKESFGMSQPAVALSFTNIMNPHLFFFAPFFFALSISYLLVARVLPCSKPVGHIHVPAKGIIFHLYPPSTCVEQNA